jgi:hypothetical protein
MSDDSIAEADCALCRHLNPAQRSAMRAQLIVIPLRDPVCDGCVWRPSLRTSSRTSPRRKRRRCGGGRRWRADEGWDGYACGLRLLSVRLESSSIS